MAENKKSFLLYCDTIHTVELLTDVQAGQLFKHLLAYVNDRSPELSDPMLKIAFEPIKQSLKRDLKRYEEIREKKRLAGLASAASKQQMSTHVDTSQQEPTNPTVSVSVNGIVSDSVSDSDKRERKAAFRPDFSSLPDWMVEPMRLWLKHKSEKKQSYKETGYLELVEKWKRDFPGGRGLFDAVRKSVSNNYSGVFPPDKQELDPLTQSNISDSFKDIPNGEN